MCGCSFNLVHYILNNRLFDKLMQLSLYVPCAGNGVQFGLSSAFAPGWTAPHFYMINEPNEPAGSNFTTTPLAMSGVSNDANGVTTMVIAIRGTLSSSEWRQNFKYDHVYVDNGPLIGTEVHRGYFELFQQLYPLIRAQVIAESPGRIIVTGHSLGGGLAQMVAAALAK